MDQAPPEVFFAELLKVRVENCVIVTNWPGQGESEPYLAPMHVRTQMKAGLLLPFVREANQVELEDYGLMNGLFSPGHGEVPQGLEAIEGERLMAARRLVRPSGLTLP
jgi:hypothetical protein